MITNIVQFLPGPRLKLEFLGFVIFSPLPFLVCLLQGSSGHSIGSSGVVVIWVGGGAGGML